MAMCLLKKDWGIFIACSCGYIAGVFLQSPLPFLQWMGYHNENSAVLEEGGGKQISLAVYDMSFLPELDSFLLYKPREALGGMPSISSTETELLQSLALAAFLALLSIILFGCCQVNSGTWSLAILEFYPSYWYWKVYLNGIIPS